MLDVDAVRAGKAPPVRPNPRRRLIYGLIFLFSALALWILPPYVHALRLLRTLQSSSQPTVRTVDVPGAIKMREYLPTLPRGRPVLVLAHGVHHLGIEEPRLKSFAAGLAREGVIVFTPELPDAVRYQISRSDAAVIGEAALEAKTMTGAQHVGVLGLSFSGGLALLTATDPRYGSSIDYVISVGGYDSMARVARFFGTDKEVEPNGAVVSMAAHEYGPLVMVYAHPEDYFPAEQSAAVRSVLGPFLYEDVERARQNLSSVPEPTRSTLAAWLDHHRDGLGPKIVNSITARAAELDAVSPAGKLSGLKAHVLLLHGSGDNVIPPSETEFLAQDVPRPMLGEVLISPAISHVEVEKPGWMDQIRLLHWMARMFQEIGDKKTRATRY